MKHSFKQRLAILYLISTTAIIGILLFFIVFTVSKSVFKQLDDYLISEVHKHQSDIVIDRNTIHFNQNAWMEREHRELEINPIFVEIVDKTGYILEKSPNLKDQTLKFYPDKNQTFINYKLDDIPIRQYQKQIVKNGEIYGYLLVAMSHQNAQFVIDKLKRTLFILFPIVLILLFFWAYFIAGRSIKPVADVIQTANRISQTNLKERIPLPEHKDELHHLAITINNLLDRLENAIQREKQFTSDAAHELKTPLQIMKGNMEVLLRKPRSIDTYREKIGKCIKEIDRLSYLTDQLLLLARFESQQNVLEFKQVSLDEISEQIIQKYIAEINEKHIDFKLQIKALQQVKTDPYLLHIIINNLISNAVKYTPEKGQIIIELGQKNDKIFFEITNSGSNIPEKELSKIFHPFYRSNALEQPDIKGTGLGLSIVKRLVELLDLKIEVRSDNNRTTFVIWFQ